MDAKREVPSAEFRVPSEKIILLHLLTIALLMLSVGCREAESGGIVRVGLVGPFEGRYREVGYDAYYAAKMALQDQGNLGIELVAVDDGGTIDSAADRALALAGDPLVKAVVALGYMATDAKTQLAFGDVPVIVVGDWGAKPETPSVFMLTGPNISDIISLPNSARDVTLAAKLEAPLMGNELLALQQYSRLRPNTTDVTIVSSGSLPDAEFSTRYLESAAFAPQPGLLATLTYDATQMTLEAIAESTGNTISETLSHMQYAGINGLIRFQDGYWTDAPVNFFGYDAEGVLIPVDRPVE